MGVVIHLPRMANTNLRAQPIADAPNRIRELRMARGISIGKFAERIGTGHSVLLRLETGERSLDVDWMRRIAEALGVTPGDLLNPADNPHAARTPDERVVLTGMQNDPAMALSIRSSMETLRNFAENRTDYRPQPFDPNDPNLPRSN